MARSGPAAAGTAAVTVAPTTDRFQAAALVKQQARAIGFDLCGITAAEPSRHADYLLQWLADGHAGQMHYLHERIDERTDVRQLLPGAQSVICVAVNYHVPLEQDVSPVQPLKIARYALGEDYHTHVKDRLYALADWLRETFPGEQTRCGVDTAPILERELAERAGIGWIGKNACVINDRIGSWLLLGEVITTLPLANDAPATDRCGTCHRCIDACPTNAIAEPRKIDAERCISYLTIEHRGPIDETLARRMDGWVVGCDVCQEVCPFNGRAPVAILDELRPRQPAGSVELDAVRAWTLDDYHVATRASATRRVKLEQFRRNATIADATGAISTRRTGLRGRKG